MKNTLTIATRKSRLALWQAHAVKQALEIHNPGLSIELLPISTSGDENTQVPLAEIGGKALFVKELEISLLDGDADLAVHSAKDMPPTLHPDLLLACALPREDARDCFITLDGKNLEDMPEGAIIGTSSPRRAAQVQHFYPHLCIQCLRGNVDTRLNKLREGKYHGIILATAGLKRLACLDASYQQLPVEQWIPSVGQGIIAIECRNQDHHTQALLAGINHAPSMQCLIAERQVIAALNGNCYSSVGVHALWLHDDLLQLQAMVFSPKGDQMITDQMQMPANQISTLGSQLGQQLLQKGAKQLLQTKSKGNDSVLL